MATTILKWAGGKNRVVSEIVSLFPKDYKERRYHEPFIGGGAVFFNLKPRKGTINDLNSHLINFYKIIKDKPEELIEETYRNSYNKETYYELREKFNNQRLTSVEDASIFLYLNKTGYNGLFRVNKSGEFNVPFGRYKNPKIVDIPKIMYASEVLKKVEIFCSDFSYLLNVAEKGDLVYIDPPYIPLSKTSKFTNYTKESFGEIEQKRLKDFCDKLHEKEVLFVQSNSESARSMYQEYKIYEVKVSRAINTKADGRQPITEILVTNILK
jgi:DNA adenine methylase